MRSKAYWMTVSAMLLLSMASNVTAGDGGTVVVRVETMPEIGSRTLQFEGAPEGSVTLGDDGRGSLSMDVAAGSHASRLVRIDQRLLDAGYRLVSVSCDDVASATRSDGSVQEQRADFAVDAGETVSCTFQLGVDLGCTCPKEGRWRADNHVGSMVCSGAMNMTMPLKAQRDSGRITVSEDCTRIHGDSLGDDEADIDMLRQPDCSWKGSVGGEQDGIPMTIHFRWNVESETRITGDLYSSVSQQGMTCEMKRTYQLDFEG